MKHRSVAQPRSMGSASIEGRTSDYHHEILQVITSSFEIKIIPTTPTKNVDSFAASAISRSDGLHEKPVRQGSVKRATAEFEMDEPGHNSISTEAMAIVRYRRLKLAMSFDGVLVRPYTD